MVSKFLLHKCYVEFIVYGTVTPGGISLPVLFDMMNESIDERMYYTPLNEMVKALYILILKKALLDPASGSGRLSLEVHNRCLVNMPPGTLVKGLWDHQNAVYVKIGPWSINVSVTLKISEVRAVGNVSLGAALDLKLSKEDQAEIDGLLARYGLKYRLGQVTQRGEKYKPELTNHF